MGGVEMVNHEKLFTDALSLKDPLYVKSVDFDSGVGELHIWIDFKKGARFDCPACSHAGMPVYDTADKTWRHLNFFQYKTYIHFRTPRIQCPQDGVRMIDVPWAAPGSGFTLLFEAFVLQLATAMPVERIGALIGEYDTRLWRIVQRYVEEARNEADYSSVHTVGVDETSSRKGHNYVSIFVDMDESRVIHAIEGKDSGVFTSFKEVLAKRSIDSNQVTQICMDMSPAFRKGAEACFPNADLTFDKFHIIKSMNDALDKVRRDEQKEHRELKSSRYLWLYNPTRLSAGQSRQITALTKLNLKTVRAYRIKLALQDIYRTVTGKQEAIKQLKSWYGWARRSRLEPIKEFAKTIKNNWNGIVNYFESKLTSGIMESINSIVQSARNRAKGYRNVNNFIAMIFLLGGKLKFKCGLSMA